MKQVRLGSDTVAAIGQGTMGIGGYFERDDARDQTHVELLTLGLDLGMTVIDTAEVYGDGHAEELVGQAIAGRRQQATVMTKYSAEHSRAEQIIAAAEGSLKRLNTDYIDVYQPHWPNPQIPLDESLEALDQLMQVGKVRSVGLSNFQIPAAQLTIGSLANGNLTCLQSEYSLVERTVESSLLPFCDRNGLALIAYSPYQQGKLLERNARTEPLHAMAADYHVTPAQLALAWLIRHPSVLVIPKASREQSLRENAHVVNLDIASADLDKLSDAFSSAIESVPVSSIDVAVAEHSKKVYRTLADAMANPLDMSPSPIELSREIIAAGGKLQKPVKLRFDAATGRYELLEGRLKYWGWLIAYGENSSIPALVEK